MHPREKQRPVIMPKMKPVVQTIRRAEAPPLRLFGDLDTEAKDN